MAGGKKVIVGGKGASLTPRDVFNVVAAGYAAELDSAALEKLQKRATAPAKGAKGPKGAKGGPGPNAGAADAAPSAEAPAPAAAGDDAGAAAVGGASGAAEADATCPWAGESLGREEARAAVLMRAVELLASPPAALGGAAPSLPLFLASLLNSGVDLVLPADPMDPPVLRAIQGAAAGAGFAGEWEGGSGSGMAVVPLREKLASLSSAAEISGGGEAGGVPVPPLDSPAAAAGGDSMAATAGIGALAVHLASSLTTLADAVAALSCEALQADMGASLEPGAGEGQHKWRTEVISDLKSLLQGSKCINPRKGGTVLRAVLGVPQCHGAYREAAKAAASAVRVELNPAGAGEGAGAGGEAGASAGKGGKGGGGAGEGAPPAFIPSFFVAGALCSLLRALGPLASCSVKRLARAAQLIAELEAAVGEEGLQALTQKHPWMAHFPSDSLVSVVLEAAAHADALKCSAAEIGRAVALGDIGEDPEVEPLQAQAQAQIQGLSLGSSRGNEAAGAGAGSHVGVPTGVPGGLPASKASFFPVKMDSLALAGGVPGVAAACTACRGADAARRLLAQEALAALRLLALREAQQAARGVPGGKGGPQGPVLGKGTALLREHLESVLAQGGEEGGSSASEGVENSSDKKGSVKNGTADPVGAAEAAFDPRGESLGALEQKLRGAIESNEARRAPKIAKGTRDFLPDQMAIRERAFGIITAVFKRHGAVALDTPVFELRETLTGKYGEDSKLIYDLADQGGEILSLRYDLTVPFARYLAMHSVGNIKRYHIARVYRRDNPQMSRGRYREFYQCDFDIAGQYAPMVPDAEVLKVLTELLSELDIGEFEIKLNHRCLLDGMLEICGVPSSKFRAICSAVDKLDKEPWEAIRAEMVNEKGLPGPVADRIGEFVVKRGAPLALLAELRAPGGPFEGHAGSQGALGELALLFDFLEAMGALHRIVFDLSLARGLDYYTGVIYEAVFCGGSQVGSIAAGGRYDNLVGMFSGKQVPAVGVSLGIERVFTIMEERERSKNELIRSTQTEVLVASIGPDLLRKRMEVTSSLWRAGIKAEFVMAAAPNMQRQLEFANKAGIPWMVLFGSSELEKGEVKVKDLINRTEEDVDVGSLVETLRLRLKAASP